MLASWHLFEVSMGPWFDTTGCISLFFLTFSSTPILGPAVTLATVLELRFSSLDYVVCVMVKPALAAILI